MRKTVLVVLLALIMMSGCCTHKASFERLKANLLLIKTSYASALEKDPRMTPERKKHRLGLVDDSIKLCEAGMNIAPITSWTGGSE